MKKTLAVLLLTLPLMAMAKNHEVKMLDTGKEGSMVFEPGFVKGLY